MNLKWGGGGKQFFFLNKQKKAGKWKSLCHTVGYKWMTVNLNSIIHMMCAKNGSELRRFGSLGYFILYALILLLLICIHF